MNLATLWAHERARVCAATLSPPPGPTDATPHGGHALKRQSSNSSLAAPANGNSNSSVNGGGGASGAKKKVSMLVRRESVYTRLIEESALPLAEPPAGDGARSLCYERNEFAMEYADRAPRRFLQQHQHPHVANAVAGTSAREQAPPGAPSDALVGGASKPTKRETSVLQPVGGSSPAAMPKVTALVAAATGGFPRRNPRKRGNGNSLELAPHAFKPYVGDMFSTRGDYVEGMLYMSRMKRSHQLTFGRDASAFAPAGRGALKGAVADAVSAAVGNLNVTGGDSSSVGASSKPTSVASSMARSNGSAAVLLSEMSPEEILQLHQRQRCSLTLSNWSSNPENARLMVQENVVEALILLCKASDGDRVTKLHCVTTFMNLSHVDELRSEIVQQGAVKTLVEIANDSDDDKTLRTACAITLCNLCCCLEGEEEILVEDGAVSALSLLINEHPKTASICLGALYNLTCVREPYHKIESVLKVFLTLASSSSATTSPNNVGRHEIIAKAVCNLSNFKRVRLRLMEEGIVSAISNLIHPNNSQIQQLLAYVLLNLSAMRACRSELVAKGCLGALAALASAASAKDGETKCLVALSLWNLSKESGNRLRMVFEGFLLLVNDLCRGSSLNDAHAEAVRTVCARAVYNVSCNEETRLKLVERDAVSILSSLSHRCVGDDGKKMCTLSLCNLLSVQQAAADIVSAGAITSLIELSMVTVPQHTLETRHLFSKALHGLCEMATTRCAVVQAGIIPAIIHLSSISLPSTSNGTVGARQAGLLSEIRAQCTASLACLAADESLASAVCTPEVARSVVQILVQERFNIAIERVCCLCLSLLCRDEQCSLVVADEGAIEAVLSTCVETQDVETKASCCHVLASMSCHQSCCMALVNKGAVHVLSTLAKTGMSKGSGSAVHRCCAITLSNLSADREIRSILVNSSIVPLLSLLSNSYSEDSQRDCARVLCNLSSVEGYETALVQEGALGVLMMISMVRALQPATKETCVRAFSNLLTPATARAMINEGIVKVLPAFAGLAAASHSKNGGSDTEFASSVVHAVSVIFGKLLCYDDGRQALRSESTALRALVSLRPHRQEEEDDNLYESLLCGTVYYEELRERSVDAGIIDALHQIVAECVARGRPVSQIALMLFTLAKHDTTRSAAASPSSLATLATFLSSDVPAVPCEPDSVLCSVSTLCHLAWHESTRLRVSAHEITQPLTRLLHKVVEGGETCPSEPTIAACLLTLCCLSDSGDHLSAMLQESIMTNLLDLMNLNSLDTSKLLPLVCILFRQLSNAPAFEAALTRSSSQAAAAIKLFCLLARRASAEGDFYAALDCADTLCSITFLPPTTNTKANNPNKPLPFVRRQSQPRLARRGSMAASSSVPPSALISTDVLETIGLLMSGESNHLAETRWRCMAAIYAFSCIADYRHTLVRLGCSRLLVQEAARAHDSVSTVELATLRCCAGALCNLTIVSGANANANAQTMIKEEAVPALIQLAKRENDEIREYCTLALSNLSSQSPKVESGAVSALLSLSLRPGNTSGSELNSQDGVSRPPPVVNARHKEISALPDHALTLELPEEVLNRKHEAAQGQASKPPPPHLPILAPDLSMVGGLSRSAPSAHGNVTNTASDGADANANREESMLRRRRSSSIGDMMGISPVTTPASGSSSSRTDGGVASVDGDLRGWQTLSFPKIDPVESRALNMDMNDTTDPADTDDTPALGFDDGNTSPADASGGESGREYGSDLDDTRSESDDATSKTRSKAGGGPNTLSPLARVVIRKAQTSHAIQKLKSMRSGTLRNSATTSTSSLPLATVQETQEANNTLARNPSSRRVPGTQPSISKSYSLHKLGTPKSLSVSHLADPASEPYKSIIPTEVGPHDSPGESSVPEASSSSVAAAAAAALLYSAGPAAAAPARAVPSTTKSKAPKPSESKTKAKQSAPEEETRRVVAPVVSTIEDVQAQVKLLGLWN